MKSKIIGIESNTKICDLIIRPKITIMIINPINEKSLVI